jgi:hypothetical protein
VPELINWSADGIDHISSRSARYPGAVDIEPEWTQEVFGDPELIAFEPDPKSRSARPGSSANLKWRELCWWLSRTAI